MIKFDILDFPKKGTFDSLLEFKKIKLDEKIKELTKVHDLNKFNLLYYRYHSIDKELRYYCFYFDWFPHIQILSGDSGNDIIREICKYYSRNLIDEKIKWIHLENGYIFDFGEKFGKIWNFNSKSE